jgi:hypothetical protein
LHKASKEIICSKKGVARGNFVSKGSCNKALNYAKWKCFNVDFQFLFYNGHALKMNVGILRLSGKCESLSK